MGKRIDTQLIQARSQELEQIVQDGRYFETVESEGRTPEGIKEAARKVLGLPEDGIILLESVSIMKKRNVKTQALVLFLNSAGTIENLGLTDEEASVINKIRVKVENELCETYDIELEDLYSEEI